MDRRASTALAWAALALGIAAVGWLVWAVRGLPNADTLRDTVYARRDPSVRSVWVPLWAVADTLQTAVVVWEDPAFHHHGAVNYPEVVRSAWIDLHAGRYTRGASTLTQQVIKNQFLSPEKTLLRKVREIILARRLERVMTKDQILTVYLNVAEWGDGIAGAEAASRHYFSKPAARLDWPEAALLAGILPNPSGWNPCIDAARALEARHSVLAKLLEYGHLTLEEYREAEAAPLAHCPAR